LLWGISPWHIQVLCFPVTFGNETGYGFGLEAVQNMTVDQVMMIFAKRKHLRKNSKVRSGSALEFYSLLRPDGTMKGRARDGTEISASIKGKSRAQFLTEQAAAKRLQEAEDAKKKAQEATPKRRRNRRNK